MEGARKAPLCGAQNHGRIFLSLSFLLPHPVDSRQLVKQSVSRFGCSLDVAEAEAMPLLRWLRSSVAVSMMFLLLLLHHSILILEQWGGG